MVLLVLLAILNRGRWQEPCWCGTGFQARLSSRDGALVPARLTQANCSAAAPEILRGNAYGPEVDMWSVGVILYIL